MTAIMMPPPRLTQQPEAGTECVIMMQWQWCGSSFRVGPRRSPGRGLRVARRRSCRHEIIVSAGRHNRHLETCTDGISRDKSGYPWMISLDLGISRDIPTYP